MHKLTAVAWMADFATRIDAAADELTELDRLIGDADHGSNMQRGMAAVTALDPDGLPDAASYLKKAAMTLVSTVGGASGPLYGSLLMRFAGTIGDGEETATSMAVAWRAALDAVQLRGKAIVEDKTMVDALSPAVEAMEAPGQTLAQCLSAATAAAVAGRDHTTALVARKGRASYLGARSAGVADPGATSLVLLLQSAERTFC